MKPNIFIFKQLINRKSEQGFTLIELSLALVMSAVVIAAAGTGLVIMMQGKKDSLNKSERKMELNRALDFMAEEVRMAEVILDISSVGSVSVANTTNPKKILALKIPVPEWVDPDDPNNTKPATTVQIIYYLATPTSSSIWSGDRVLYRHGPSLNIDGGGYRKDDGNIYTSQNELLIDSINITPSSDFSSCPDDAPNQTNTTITEGFIACVDTNKRRVNLYLYGDLDPNDKKTDSDPIGITTRVFTRN